MSPEPHKKVLVIAARPTLSAAKSGNPVSGPGWEIVRRVLSQLGCEIVGETNVLDQPLPFDREPSKTELSKASIKDRIEFLVESRGANLVVLLGKALANHVGVTFLPARISLYGTDACCVKDPAFLVNAPGKFPAWLADLRRVLADPRDPSMSYEVAEDPEYAASRLDAMGDPLFLDLETTSLDPGEGEVVLAVVWDGDPTKDVLILPKDVLWSGPVMEALKRLARSRTVVGSNFGDFDWRWFRRRGIVWESVFDTVIAHHLVDENAESHDLESLAAIYAGMTGWKHMVGKWRKSETIPMDTLCRYAVKDIVATKLVYEGVLKDLKDEGQEDVFTSLVKPATVVLTAMSEEGVPLDVELVERTREEYAAKISELEYELQKQAWAGFNPASPKQVARLLFELNGLPSVSGGSTDRKTLERLNEAYGDRVPVIGLLLNHREMTKLKGTYMDGLLGKVGRDGMVRTHFKLNGTVTGRLSSSDPNLQNIPKKIGPMVRDFFRAPEGMSVVDADYSQLELRVGAWLSKDPELVRLLNGDYDLHRQVASQIYHVPPEDVDPIQRTRAKAGTFGVMYGMDTEGAMYNLGLTREEAEELVVGLRRVFAGLDAWAAHIREKAFKDGYVETPFGRCRRFPLVVPANMRDVARQAVNSVIQSTASDVCLTALIKMWNARTDDFRPIITVHDSIVCLVSNDKLEVYTQFIKDTMEDFPFPTNVPFKVDVKIGERWGSVE